MSQPKAPVFTPPAGWKKISLPYRIGSGRNFPDTVLRMAFFKDPSDEALVGKVWLGEQLEGPPHHVHGGASAYVLDEACGTAGWAAMYPVVARKIEIEFLKMTPTHVDLDIRAVITSVEDRDVVVEAKIFDQKSGLVYSQAKGIFARLRREKFQLFNQPGFDVNQFKFPK